MELDFPQQGEGTGAAALFGATGGVMEAALRTAYELLTGQLVYGLWGGCCAFPEELCSQTAVALGPLLLASSLSAECP